MRGRSRGPRLHARRSAAASSAGRAESRAQARPAIPAGRRPRSCATAASLRPRSSPAVRVRRTNPACWRYARGRCSSRRCARSTFGRKPCSSTPPAETIRGGRGLRSSSGRCSRCRRPASPTGCSSRRARGHLTRRARRARSTSRETWSAGGCGRGRGRGRSPCTPAGGSTPTPRLRSCSRALPTGRGGRLSRSARRDAWHVMPERARERSGECVS